MMRVSHEELVERWAQTYADEGFEVRADNVAGYAAPTTIHGARPDIEATREGQRVLVRIIESSEGLTDPEVRRVVRRLSEARGAAQALHLIVAAECMLELNAKLAEWGVEPDVVHVT